ncbi:MAG: ADOP family duplicated permease [Terriglobia bacterium]
MIVDRRLPPKVTLAQANSWMAVIGKRYVQTHPEQIGHDDKLKVTTLQQQITGNIRPALLILLGAVGLVLLIACANVANLLLARGTGRQKEIAVRTAVGAGRGRIVRQLLTESLLLALAGGALGLVFGSLGVRALMALAPVYVPRVQEITANPAFDPRTAGFAGLLVVITVVLFGLFPALQISHPDLNSSLKESSGRTGAGPAHSRTRSILVASEMAMAVVLLSGAALLIRSFVALHTQSLGFDPHNILTMEVSLAGPSYSKSSEVDRLTGQTVERIEHVPGVESAAVTSAMPLTGGGMDMIFNIPGRPPAKGQKFTGDVQWRIVSPEYFKVLRIPLLSGRLLQQGEPGRTVVINQAMAHEFWPKMNPIGRSILIGAGLGPAFEEGAAVVVGVVGDVRLQLGNEPVPVMYQIPRQVPDGAMALMDGVEHSDIVVRTKPGVAPMSVSRGVQRLLMAGNGLGATKVRTMSQVSLDSTARRNFRLILLGLFAAVALLLAAVGLYGVIAYSVSQRSHEIGIRMALGAQKRDVLRLVVGQGMILALSGVGIGIAGAFGLMRLLSSLLYGVKPSDPITFTAVSLLLTGVALLACYIPARRAAKVDPTVALRHE